MLVLQGTVMLDQCCMKGRATRISRLCERAESMGCGTARALFGADGADDEAMLAGRIEGNFGAGGSYFHQGDNGGIVEHFRRGQADVADLVAAALQNLFRVGQRFALQEK